LLGFHGERRRAGGGVLHIEQGLGKSPKIVNGSGCAHGGYLRAPRFPVRADTQNGGGCWERFAQGSPLGRKYVVFDGVHRATMSHKQRRHGLALVGLV